MLHLDDRVNNEKYLNDRMDIKNYADLHLNPNKRY